MQTRSRVEFRIGFNTSTWRRLPGRVEPGWWRREEDAARTTEQNNVRVPTPKYRDTPSVTGDVLPLTDREGVYIYTYIYTHIYDAVVPSQGRRPAEHYTVVSSIYYFVPHISTAIENSHGRPAGGGPVVAEPGKSCLNQVVRQGKVLRRQEPLGESLIEENKSRQGVRRIILHEMR